MKKLHWCAGIILGFSIIAALLITSFEIAMYADFDVYQREYEKYDLSCISAANKNPTPSV